jgi:hypothetical protein
VPTAAAPPFEKEAKMTKNDPHRIFEFFSQTQNPLGRNNFDRERFRLKKNDSEKVALCFTQKERR